MLIDSKLFATRLREHEARLRKKADLLTSTEVNSNGNTGIKVQPEAIQMLKAADDLHAIAAEIEAIEGSAA